MNFSSAFNVCCYPFNLKDSGDDMIDFQLAELPANVIIPWVVLVVYTAKEYPQIFNLDMSWLWVSYSTIAVLLHVYALGVQ